MPEYLNNIYFIVSAILVYLLLALQSAVSISQYARNVYDKIIKELSTLIRKNKQADRAVNFIGKIVIPGTGHFVLKFINVLNTVSSTLIRFDKFLQDEVYGNIGEPVNYSALLLRKLYEGESRVWVIYSVISIVAFYFILTIF